MKLCYLTLIALLGVAQPSCEAPVLGEVSQPSNYSVNLVFDNQCASRNEVEELTKQQGSDLEQTLLNAQGKFYQKLATCLDQPSPGTSSSVNQNILENIVESLSNLTEEVRSFKQQSLIGTLDHPALSCEQLYSVPKLSGYYYIRPANVTTRVYCDMDRVCGCDTGNRGWMKVADIDMTKQQQCPEGFKLITRTTPPYRTCGRPGRFTGCVSTTFATHNMRYSRVCGRVMGYQIGSPDAFLGSSRGIESNYMYGISLTHGQSPRRHVWTFAAAVNEGSTHTGSVCPCSNSAHSATIPSFVGNDYFCDSSLIGNSRFVNGHFYPTNPLWDGEGCGSSSTCCQFNNPPWFCKQLPQPTTDDIELRLCHDNTGDDSPFELVELFVY